jgi:hypothetical protein
MTLHCFFRLGLRSGSERSLDPCFQEGPSRALTGGFLALPRQVGPRDSEVLYVTWLISLARLQCMNKTPAIVKGTYGVGFFLSMMGSWIWILHRRFHNTLSFVMMVYEWLGLHVIPPPFYDGYEVMIP